MVWCRAATLALGVVAAASHGCREEDPTCSEDAAIDVSFPALLQTRQHKFPLGSLSVVEQNKDNALAGEDVAVHCDPSCKDAEEFSMTLVSRAHGNMTFKMMRNRDLVTPDFHITILQENDTVIRKKVPQRLLDCHYHGDQVGGVGWVAASTCGAMRATMLIDGEILELQQRSDGSFVVGGPAVPLEAEPSLMEFEEYVEAEKNDCDGGACCTAEGTFVEAGTACFVDDVGYCHAGGTCTGEDNECRLDVLPNGSPCPDDGSCFDGQCISRERQCELSGFRYGACKESECGLLSCLKADGACESIFDIAVQPGSPCGDSMQCDFEGKCGPSSNLDKDTFGKVTEVMNHAKVKAHTTANMNQGMVAAVHFVITAAGQRVGWSQGKASEIANWLNSLYQRYMQLGVRLAGVTMNGPAYPPEQLQAFGQWIASEKHRGRIRGAGIHTLIHARDCFAGAAGMGYVGSACQNNYDVNANIVAGPDGRPCGPAGFDKITVAHEMGHNVGMPHLWENNGPPKSSSVYIMDYSRNPKAEFHPNSVRSYNNEKRKFTCFSGGGGGTNPPGGGGPCVDTDQWCSFYQQQGYCDRSESVKRDCRKSCGRCTGGGSRTGGGNCVDTERNHCALYQRQGYCGYVASVQQTCKRTCGLCGGALKKNSTTSSTR